MYTAPTLTPKGQKLRTLPGGSWPIKQASIIASASQPTALTSVFDEAHHVPYADRLLVPSPRQALGEQHQVVEAALPEVIELHALRARAHEAKR